MKKFFKTPPPSAERKKFFVKTRNWVYSVIWIESWFFRISFHPLKTQLQKCFIKPCFKKDHMFYLSLKIYIFSWNYTHHILKKKKKISSLAIIPLLVQHWHQVPCHIFTPIKCVFTALGSSPGFLSQALSQPSQPLFFHQRRSVHPLVAPSKLLIDSFLSALQSCGMWWLLCSTPPIHP